MSTRTKLAGSMSGRFPAYVARALRVPPATCTCKAADAVKDGTRSSCSPVLSSTARVAVTLITPPRRDERRPANCREPPVIGAGAMCWGTDEVSGGSIYVTPTALSHDLAYIPPGL